MQKLESIQLENGLSAVWEHLPHIHSMLIGVWIRKGSRHELAHEQGITHFLEHMLFKGTHKLSALEIAETLENVGGELNGFTSKENSCYYAKAVIHEADRVYDVLSQMVFQSLLQPEDMQKERQVILQEIDMVEENPEELSHDKIVETMFDPPLGHPVIGSADPIESFNAKTLQTRYQQICNPQNILITMVGNFSHRDPVRDLYKYFNHPRGPATVCQQRQAQALQDVRYCPKNIEQLHLNTAWHTVSMTDPRRYALHLISSWLGGGMSSELFQELRERQGLCYSVYSYVRAYSDSGTLGIYSAQSPEHVVPALNLQHEIVMRLLNEGIESMRLQQLKSQLCGGLLLGLEKTSFRMNRIAVGKMYFDHIHTPEELMDLVHQVKNQDIQEIAALVFGPNPSIVGVGPLSEDHFMAEIRRSSYADSIPVT